MLLLSDVPKSLHKSFMADMENAIGQYDSSLSYFAVFHAFGFSFVDGKNGETEPGFRLPKINQKPWMPRSAGG